MDLTGISYVFLQLHWKYIDLTWRALAPKRYTKDEKHMLYFRL